MSDFDTPTDVRADLGYEARSPYAPPTPKRAPAPIAATATFQALRAEAEAATAAHAKGCDKADDCIVCGRFFCRSCPPGKRSLMRSPGKCEACTAASLEAAQARRWEQLCDHAIPRRFREFRVGGSNVLVKLIGRKANHELCTVPADGDVVFVGAPGVGKTIAACALLRHWPRKSGTPAFATAMDLARAAAEHPLGHGQAPAVTAAIRASVLVLDDLGQEGAAYRGDVEYVIAARHNEGKSTIFTTFLDGEGIEARYGGGIGRRVYERSTVIEPNKRDQ
jgi:DNA replication protein DnaC